MRRVREISEASDGTCLQGPFHGATIPAKQAARPLLNNLKDPARLSPEDLKTREKYTMISSRRRQSTSCRRGPALLGAMAVMATACFAAPTISRASPINYQLSGATATFTSPPGTLTLTGNFTYDPASNTFDSAAITATGPTTILNASPEIFDFVLDGSLRFISVRDQTPVPPVTITLRFFDALGGLSPNLIDGFDIGNSINLTATNVTGDAIPVSAPEPPGILLLGAALAALFVLRSPANRQSRETCLP